jgi:4-hydroxy-tetrahydrodipicolinate synthase
MWCATLTPLTADGALDVARLADHARRLFASGVQGIAPFGTTGEGPSFSPRERRAGLDALLDAGIAAGRILAPTTCPDLPDTIAMSRHAVEAGCAGCLVLPPFFFKGPSDEGLYAWYARLIEGVADDRLRVYLYNLPQVSAVAITPALARRLRADFPRIVAGVKDSGGDFAHTTALIDAMPGAAVMVGHEPHLPQLMRAGGAGTVCGVANLFPGLVQGLLRPDASAEDERGIRALLDVLFRFPLIPAMKSLLAWQRGEASWHAVRPPLVALGDEENRDLRAALHEGGFL